jgi:hypothetical protein
MLVPPFPAIAAAAGQPGPHLQDRSRLPDTRSHAYSPWSPSQLVTPRRLLHRPAWRCRHHLGLEFRRLHRWGDHSMDTSVNSPPDAMRKILPRGCRTRLSRPWSRPAQRGRAAGTGASSPCLRRRRLWRCAVASSLTARRPLRAFAGPARRCSAPAHKPRFSVPPEVPVGQRGGCVNHSVGPGV